MSRPLSTRIKILLGVLPAALLAIWLVPSEKPAYSKQRTLHLVFSDNIVTVQNDRLGTVEDLQISIQSQHLSVKQKFSWRQEKDYFVPVEVPVDKPLSLEHREMAQFVLPDQAVGTKLTVTFSRDGVAQAEVYPILK